MRRNSGKNSGIRWIRPIKIGNSGIFAGIPPQKRPLSLMPRGFAPPEFLPEFGASTMTKGRCSVMRVWWSDCEVLSAAELTQRAEQEGSVVMRVPAFGTYPHGLIVIQQAGAPLWAVPLRSNGSAAVFDVFQPIRCQWDRWIGPAIAGYHRIDSVTGACCPGLSGCLEESYKLCRIRGT